MLSKLKIDIIHAHQYGIWAGYWSIFHNVPLLTTLHSSPHGSVKRLTEKIIFHLSLKLNRNLLVGISQYNMELIKEYWHLDDKKVNFVNNGVFIGFKQIPHETFTFINISRQDKNKNQSLILKAFSKLYYENISQSLKLFLIGDGDTHRLLIKEADNLGIKDLVVFTGYVSSAWEYLSISDIYISSSNREGLSLSVLEAMSLELPIIATDAGGVRDLAKDNGILIPCNDEQALYLAMKKLKEDKELRIIKGKKSLELVQDYSSQKMANNYCDIYYNLLSPK